jgi:hypothetical protein
MQVLQIDLAKSPEIADEVADSQPGDEVTLHATIKSLDSQTLTVTVSEISPLRGDEPAPKEINLTPKPAMMVEEEIV